jgi:hypothetical protein
LNDLLICHQNRDTKTPLFAIENVVKAIMYWFRGIVGEKKEKTNSISNKSLFLKENLLNFLCTLFSIISYALKGSVFRMV